MHRQLTIGFAVLCLVMTPPSLSAQQKATVPAVRLTASSRTLLSYVPDDAVFVAAAQPARVINSNGLKTLLDATEGQDVRTELLSKCVETFGLKIEEVEEIGVMLDLRLLRELTSHATQDAQTVNRLNGLRQVALAMHNFHDTHGSLPDDDGAADENKGNLSWRVHLLPFLDEVDLYNQFHFDEPWDSEHNKSLIEEMPAVFETSGTEEKGHTSMHVLTGPGTPFDGEDAPSFRMITDGTSNTIMALNAGPDKSEAWTKPGGLKIDPENPIAALGNIEEQFSVAFLDGSVRKIPAKIDSIELLYMMQHSDGNMVQHDVYSPATRSSAPAPGIVVRCSNKIDQPAVLSRLSVLKDTETPKIGGLNSHRMTSGILIVFPDPKTMLLGSESSLSTMLEKRAKSGETKARFEKLYPSCDIAVALNMEPLQEHVPDVLGPVPIPIATLIQSITSVAASVDIVGTSESVVHIDVNTADDSNAQQLNAMANGGFQMLKAQTLGTAARDNSPAAEQLSEVLSTLLDSVEIEAEGTRVLLNMPKPENPKLFIDGITPAVGEILKGVRGSREVAERRKQMNPLKQLGLAFHNYHDSYGGFPSFEGPHSDQAIGKGLSWRVHLLPFLEESALYEEFHLDEPWDSEHNKTLIERMPTIFECDGVEKPGHTALHVFTGEETPFGSGEPIKIFQITDGTSITIMVVAAGADTADVWTKPSGLEFNPEDPKKALGKIGEQFLILLCDGSVRFVRRDIDDQTLSHLIQHADGNPLGDF